MPAAAEWLPGCLPFAGSSGHIQLTLARPEVVSELAVLMPADLALLPGARACSPPDELVLQGALVALQRPHAATIRALM